MKLNDVNVLDFANDVTRHALDSDNRHFEVVDLGSAYNEKTDSTIYYCEVAVREAGWQVDRIDLEIDSIEQVYRLTSHPGHVTRRILAESPDFDVISQWIDSEIQTYTV